MNQETLAPGEVEAPSKDHLYLMLSSIDDDNMPKEYPNLREDIATKIPNAINAEALRIRHILEECRIGNVPIVLIEQL